MSFFSQSSDDRYELSLFAESMDDVVRRVRNHVVHRNGLRLDADRVRQLVLTLTALEGLLDPESGPTRAIEPEGAMQIPTAVIDKLDAERLAGAPPVTADLPGLVAHFGHDGRDLTEHDVQVLDRIAKASESQLTGSAGSATRF